MVLDGLREDGRLVTLQRHRDDERVPGEPEPGQAAGGVGGRERPGRELVEEVTLKSPFRVRDGA